MLVTLGGALPSVTFLCTTHMVSGHAYFTPKSIPVIIGSSHMQFC